MSKRKKIVTSQIESNDSNNSEANTFSYGINGNISYYDSNSIEHPFMEPGVVYGANYDSSDQSNLNTIKLIPDESIYTAADQYLIIEPTAPDHIHIRAGGAKDASRAELILGGERNKIQVSDDNRSVGITSQPAQLSYSYLNINEANNAQFITNMPIEVEVGYTVTDGGTEYTVSAVAINTPTEGLVTVTATGLNNFAPDTTYTFTFDPDYDYQWTFSSNGVLYGPAMGGVLVSGIVGEENDPLYIYSSEQVIIDGGTGEYLGSIAPENQIAKIAYSREHYTTAATVTGAIADMGKLLYANCGDGDMTYLIPDNGDVAFPIGSEIKFATGGDARWFINRDNVEGPTDLIADGGNGYTGINDPYPYIIPLYSTGTLLKVDTNRWILSGMRLTD